MLTYWTAFVILAWMAMSHARPRAAGIQTLPGLNWQLTFIALSLFIGLRHEVGADWFAYISSIENAAQESFLGYFKFIGFVDPTYTTLNWLAANLGGGVYFVNLICGVLFTWGLLAFCREQRRPWLALLVALPYLVTVVAMGYTRQGVAIGVSMLGLAALGRGQIWRFVFWIAFAATFHKSAIILVPFAAMVGSKNRWLTMMVVASVTVLLFLLLLQESVDVLVLTYIESEYGSSGSALRVAMNALPAAVFLWRRKYFGLMPDQLKFWTYVSYMALGFIVFLAISPSTTAVDRVALYWIPLQLFVLSRLPDAMGIPGRRNIFWVYAVVAYSTLVLFVWLFFSDHAFAWLPYQFYPWVWLWQ